MRAPCGSKATICYDILTEVKKVSADLDGYSLVLRVNPEIARALKEESRSVLKELEATVGECEGLDHDDDGDHDDTNRRAEQDGGQGTTDQVPGGTSSHGEVEHLRGEDRHRAVQHPRDR